MAQPYGDPAAAAWECWQKAFAKTEHEPEWAIAAGLFAIANELKRATATQAHIRDVEEQELAEAVKDAGARVSEAIDRISGLGER